MWSTCEENAARDGSSMARRRRIRHDRSRQAGAGRTKRVADFAGRLYGGKARRRDRADAGACTIGDTEFAEPPMPDDAQAQAPLETVLKDEIIRMYQEVADRPEGEYHFYHGREAAELFGYEPRWLDRAPPGAVASFAGVGNPHLRSAIRAGETVLDLGSGAGLDAIIASWSSGPTGKVIGVDLNPTMCLKAQAHAAASGSTLQCHQGQMENIPLPDGSVDVVISNGVVNLSFRKRKVIEELFRVLRPGGRLSITDIVSAKQLSQSIVNDPKLWAS
jgi:2-polyprenyl-3-methyl-5-hydroxy-6-metoxy-1,4-benzoquinol methylase